MLDQRYRRGVLVLQHCRTVEREPQNLEPGPCVNIDDRGRRGYLLEDGSGWTVDETYKGACSASSPPSMIHQVDQLLGVPDEPSSFRAATYTSQRVAGNSLPSPQSKDLTAAVFHSDVASAQKMTGTVASPLAKSFYVRDLARPKSQPTKTTNSVILQQPGGTETHQPFRRGPWQCRVRASATAMAASLTFANGAHAKTRAREPTGSMAVVRARWPQGAFISASKDG